MVYETASIGLHRASGSYWRECLPTALRPGAGANTQLAPHCADGHFCRCDLPGLSTHRSQLPRPSVAPCRAKVSVCHHAVPPAALPGPVRSQQALLMAVVMT